MEVRHHRVHNPEPISWQDEKIRRPLLRNNLPGILIPSAFENAHRCGSHGHNATATNSRFVDDFGSLIIDPEVLRVYIVISWVFLGYWTECVEPDIELHASDPNTLLFYATHQLGCEM